MTGVTVAEIRSIRTTFELKPSLYNVESILFITSPYDVTDRSDRKV